MLWHIWRGPDRDRARGLETSLRKTLATVPAPADPLGIAPGASASPRTPRNPAAEGSLSTHRRPKETTVLASNGREASEKRSGLRVRRMEVSDVERVLELRSVVRWAADPRAFDLLRGVRDARWFVAEAPDCGLAGMVGAVPLGAVGILCHLAVHHDHRGLGLGRELSAWAVAYLRSRGAKTVRLYATGPAEGLYRSLGFREVGRRTVYRLDGPAREAATRGADTLRVQTLRFGDLPELYGLDLWGHGADRSPLIFSALGLRSGRGFVARNAAGRI